MIAGAGEWWMDGETPVGPNLDIQKDIEWGGDHERFDVKLSQRCGQVIQTIRMVIIEVVLQAKHLFAAGLEQKSMATYRIFYYGEHRPAFVGIENVFPSEVNGAVVIYTSAAG